MHTPRVFADFHNADQKGRLRLNCAGAIDDLSAQHISLNEGMSLTLCSDDVEADATVVFSSDEDIWVAEIDWSAIRHPP